MKRQTTVGCLMLAAVSSVAAQRPQDFAYGMRLDADGTEALYEVALPAAVYRGVTSADLADVRVFNGAGHVVPYAWRPRRLADSTATTPIELTLFPLKAEEGTSLDGISIRVRRAADGKSSVDVVVNGTPMGSGQRTIGYLVDLTALDRALRAIDLEWAPLPDGFAGRIRVDASDDLDAWHPVVEAAPLVGLEVAGQRLQQKRVELPPHKVKYLRLAWVSRGGDGPFPNLIAARGERVGAVVDAAREWTQATAERGDEAGEYVFDLHGHAPVDRVRVDLPEPNTIVQVEWLVRDDVDRPWRLVARGVVYRLRKDGNEIVSPEMSVDVTAGRYWLLRVDQRGGGLGGGMPRLRVGWVPHSLVFAARGEPPFQLAYGNRDAKPAAYAIAALVPGYDSGDGGRQAARPGARRTVTIAPARTLGERELGGATRTGEAVDWKRWSLWGSLVLGVLLLGGMAWRLARRMASERP